MKKLTGLLLIVSILLSLACCTLNRGTSLNEPVKIPESGIIEKAYLENMKKNNTIGTFEGVSGDYMYSWTVFGKDAEELRDINLKVNINGLMNGEGIAITFDEPSALPFSAALAITLTEKISADSATLYKLTDTDKEPVRSVMITGSKTSVLNFTVRETGGEFIILPDESEETTAVLSTGENETVKQDTYIETATDKYNTSPVPEGKPAPAEPEKTTDGTKIYTCTISIECSSILNNIDKLKPEKLSMIPSDGIILSAETVEFSEGESVYDVLQRVCRENKIHLESTFTPMYNSAYIEGINNIYEFDCGNLSGWMYRVNGWYPNYGASRYKLKDGDKVEFRYTCDLGKDIGESGF